MEQFLQDCQGLCIMVVGDLMMDRYLWGKVERISPEAPVPIVDVSKEENRLGGAANVALNLHSLGAKPILCGYIGQDAAGEELISLVQNQGWETSAILPSQEKRTTVKIRIIGNQQQVLRVDKEDRAGITEAEATALILRITQQIDQCDAVIIQDYDKGLLTPYLIRRLVELAQANGKAILVDPKFEQFWSYGGVSLFKPNLKELREGLNQSLDEQDPSALRQAIQQLRNRMPHLHTLVTLGARGMIWVEDDNTHLIAAHPRSVADVSGAGDTVIAIVALGMALDLAPPTIARYANLAGGLVCESVGVVPIKPEQLLKASSL